MDGLDACKLILARQGGHPIPPVVFATAHVSVKFEAECKEAGAAGFMPKPFKIADIDRCMQGVILGKETTSSS